MYLLVSLSKINNKQNNLKHILSSIFVFFSVLIMKNKEKGNLANSPDPNQIPSVNWNKG